MRAVERRHYEEALPNRRRYLDAFTVTFVKSCTYEAKLRRHANATAKIEAIARLKTSKAALEVEVRIELGLIAGVFMRERAIKFVRSLAANDNDDEEELAIVERLASILTMKIAEYCADGNNSIKSSPCRCKTRL